MKTENISFDLLKMVFSIYFWLRKKWEILPGWLWTIWATWTARTRVIGASDLRMNLLVGDEATHNTNVPGVVKEGSVEYFPLFFYIEQKSYLWGKFLLKSS